MTTVSDPAAGPRRTRWILLAIFGGLLALAFVVIGLFVGLMAWGGSMFHEQAQAAMQQQPEIAEHLGRIESISLDVEATGAAAGAEVFVFDVVGDRGRGTVTAEFITIDEHSEALGVGELRLADGRTIGFSGPEADIQVELPETGADLSVE